MNTKTRNGLIIAGVAALGVISVGVAGNKNSDKKPESSTPTTTISTAASTAPVAESVDVDAVKSCKTESELMNLLGSYAYDVDFSGLVGKRISFTGKTNANRTNSEQIVFYSKTNEYQIKADYKNDFDHAVELEVAGTITAADYTCIELSEVSVYSKEPAETTAATAVVTTAETTATTKNEVIVYVSNKGKYHRHSDCSGMTEYTEMTIEEAKAAGYDPCGRCY